MSAIQMTCARCGGHYLAGMVGSTPWPAHMCADGKRPAERPIFGWVDKEGQPVKP
jgi:hypothetical protein